MQKQKKIGRRVPPRPPSDPPKSPQDPPEATQNRPQSSPVLRFSDPRSTCASVFRPQKHLSFGFLTLCSDLFTLSYPK